jgi:hypothetical protein
VEGPTCNYEIEQVLLKEIGSAEPWISDPTAEGAVDRAVVAAHVSTVDRPHNPKGYAISFVHHRSHGPGRVQARWRRTRRRGKAARRRLAGVAPRQRSRPPFRPQASVTRSRGACTRDKGFKGHAPAPTTAGDGRGGAAAPASLRASRYAQKEREMSGGYCSPREGETGELKGEGEATMRGRGSGGGSGGTPVRSGRSS